MNKLRAATRASDAEVRAEHARDTELHTGTSTIFVERILLIPVSLRFHCYKIPNTLFGMLVIWNTCYLECLLFGILSIWNTLILY